MTAAASHRGREPSRRPVARARVVPPLALFAVVGVMAIAGLALLPDRRDDAIDQRTGLPERTAAAVLAEAQRCGDARAALDLLADFKLRGSDTTHDLQEALRMLEAELGTPPSPPLDEHPLRSELARAGTLAELLPALRATLQDSEAAAQTELFFKPAAADLRATFDQLGPDAKAARVLRHSQSLPLATTDALAVAAAFATAGRPRARLRWLLRALESADQDARLLLQVAQTYAKDGRYVEAFLLTGTDPQREPADATFWRLRQQLATWLGQQPAEAQAIEALLAATDDDSLRLRAVELYAALGRTDLASAHASALAERSRELSHREAAAQSALEAGDANAAISHLEALAKLGDGRRARERIVEIALLDLDYDLAIHTLAALAANPDGDGYVAQLESLYRRRDRAEPLAELLWRRFQQQSADFDLGIELLHLCVGLGRRERAEQVAQMLQDAQRQPVTFFRQLQRIAATSALQREQAVEVRAAEVASSPQLTAADLPVVLEGLAPLARQRRFKPTLETLARRFSAEAPMQQFLLQLVEREHDVVASAETAKEVALLTNASDLVREWAKRAAWVGLADSERLARARLTELNPEDADNRQALAWMLTNAGQHDAALPHWRYLVEHGAHGEVADAYVTALLRCGGESEAVEFLRAQAERADAPLPDRLHAADTLLAANLTGPAAACYERVLELQPDHPQALLRLGQIRFWSNDPGGAVPLLTRLLALRGDAESEPAPTHFALAQALTALGRDAEAEPHYARTLELLERTPEVAEREAIRARCLLKLGRSEEAIAVFRSLVTNTPNDVELRVDLAELLAERGDHEGADHELEQVAALAPDHPRGLRARADAALRRDDLDGAQTLLRRTLELRGDDRSALAQLAYVAELDGDHQDALDAYRRWRGLESDNRAAQRGMANSALRVLPLAGGEGRWRRVGNDESLTAQTHTNLPLDERLRASLHAGFGSYRGRSPAVGNSARNVDAEATWLGGQLAWQWRRRDVFGVGIELYPDTPGDVASAFANLHLEGTEPYWSFDLHASYGALWSDPAAAVAFGGRRDGAVLNGYRSLGERTFVGGEFAAWSAHADAPASGQELEDTQLHGSLSLGYRWTESGQTAIADRFRRDRAPTGPLGPGLIDGDRGVLQVSSWVAFDSSRLLGNAALPAILPLGERFDYAMLATRADLAASADCGAMLEGFVGIEVHSSDATWGVSGAATWTPGDHTELTFGFGLGDALAREGGGSMSSNLFLQLHVRW